MNKPDDATIKALYDAAYEDYQVDVLDELMERAGFIWCCRCGWRNGYAFQTCEECKTPRPT